MSFAVLNPDDSRFSYRQRHNRNRRHSIAYHNMIMSDSIGAYNPYMYSVLCTYIRATSAHRTKYRVPSNLTSVSCIDRVFVHALNTVKRIPRAGTVRPPVEDRLRLYGLYKQSMGLFKMCLWE